MNEGREYSVLGQVLDELARARGVEGPEAISDRLWERAYYDVSEESVYEYLHGYDRPEPVFMRAFVQAFELTQREIEDVAWVYTYHERKEP